MVSRIWRRVGLVIFIDRLVIITLSRFGLFRPLGLFSFLLLFHLFVIFDGDEDFAGLAALVFAEDAHSSHRFNHPRGTGVADCKPSLQKRYGAALAFEDDANSLVEEFIGFHIGDIDAVELGKLGMELGFSDFLEIFDDFLYFLLIDECALGAD